MLTAKRQHLYFAAFGLAMGYILERVGFANFGEVHHLFVFTDLRLLFIFIGAVTIATAGFFLLARGKVVTQRPYHKGSIAGGVLFGIGWAFTGACPSAALIYVTVGHIAALATVLGILVGMVIFNLLKPRYFRWSTGGCE